MKFITPLTLFAISAAAVFAQEAPEKPEPPPQPIQHMRVIWKEAPQTTATISWSTTKPGEKHAVHFDTASRKDGKYKKTVKAHRNAQLTGSEKLGKPMWYHHVVLTGLKPSTRYYFSISSDKNKSPEYHFDTAPDKDASFKIIAGGDSRSNSTQRRKMNELMAELHTKDKDVIAFAHGGDYIASGRQWSQWERWLTDHTLTTNEDGRALPIIPTRGNHDGGPLYNEIFDFPPEHKNYFVTELSSAVTLITLNTETSTRGDQMEFLKKALAKHGDAKWLLAQYHKPAWPAFKGPGPSTAWVKLFEAYQFDVILESDGHNIKRTVPIKKGERNDKEGIIYVGEGGLGVGQRTPKPERWYLQPPGMTGKGHHVMVLSFEKKSIEYKVVMEDRSIKDTYSFKQRKRGTPTPAEVEAASKPDPKPAPKPEPKPAPKPAPAPAGQ